MLVIIGCCLMRSSFWRFITRAGRFPSARCTVGVALFVLAATVPGRAAVVSWDGGGGDGAWQTAANWSGNTLPGAADDVVINVAGPVTVSLASGSVTIKSLQCANGLELNGGDLTLTAGASSIQGSLLLNGGQLSVRGATSTLTATGPATHEGSSLAVSAGAQMRISNLGRLSHTNNGAIRLTSEGAGSLLELPDVTEFAVVDYYQLQLQATGGGRVRLPSLSSALGALSASASDTNSAVELTAFTGRLANPAPGNARLEAYGGGAVLIPNVTALEAVDVTLQGASQIPLAQLDQYRGQRPERMGWSGAHPGRHPTARADE